MPYYNWNKIVKEKNYDYLCKWYRFSDGICAKHFDILMAEFIDFIGVSEDYRKYLNTLVELEMLNIDYLVSEDRSLLTFIKLKELELLELEKVEKKKEINVIVYVEKYLGFSLALDVSVKKFYSYLKMMEAEASNSNNIEKWQTK
jgi:hypothetical protein